MKGGLRAAALYCLLALPILLSMPPGEALGATPNGPNVILFIGDGMGPGIIEATDRYLLGASSWGKNGEMVFEDEKLFPVHARVGTSASNVAVTDSAAAATAMATGRKVNKGTVSLAIPGDGKPLRTLLEEMKGRGCSVGLVSTSFITDATPASFGAHTDSRKNLEDIADQYLNSTRPDVLMGGGDPSLKPQALKSAGYTVLPPSASLLEDFDTEGAGRVALLIGEDRMDFVRERSLDTPGLPQLTGAALAILDNNPNCLFLMVEGGRIDQAAHSNRLLDTLAETAEFSKAVEVGVQWSKNHPNTLVAVGVDHDTGGLSLSKGAANKMGEVPTAFFATMGHTATEVDFFATAKSSISLEEVVENTAIYYFLSGFNGAQSPR